MQLFWVEFKLFYGTTIGLQNGLFSYVQFLFEVTFTIGRMCCAMKNYKDHEMDFLRGKTRVYASSTHQRNFHLISV